MQAKVVVLRWGHRPQRDVRLTSHVALSARALGAAGFVLSEAVDEKIKHTVQKVTDTWGGDFFFEMGTKWKTTVRDWKTNGGVVVHLTAYGENIQSSDVMERIKGAGKDVLVLAGSQKVPREFYDAEFSDFNVAVGNQPHSECAALAIFLDRFFKGETLGQPFEHANMHIVPQERGKKVQ
ncbi:MAG: tRNA (cytidine(56)-2'-O)-methyltransferase [Candidatus Bathyarchaeota archaeon]|nr:tRNA (cytidine(56)-2'-O)-methyltransferase [Candidatus Bathyarchaeota archaeon]